MIRSASDSAGMPAAAVVTTGVTLSVCHTGFITFAELSRTSEGARLPLLSETYSVSFAGSWQHCDFQG